MYFYPPFSYISLLYLFLPHQRCRKDFAAIPLFHLSCDKSPVSRVTSSNWGRESACGRLPERMGALKIFGHIPVQSAVTCMADKCYIHCAMLLRLMSYTLFSVHKKCSLFNGGILALNHLQFK